MTTGAPVKQPEVACADSDPRSNSVPLLRFSLKAEHQEVSFSILGSCVTREPLNYTEWKPEVYLARTALASIASEPIDFGFDMALSKQTSFENRCIEADQRKDWFERLAVPYDVLVLDFIDERFGLGEIGGKIFNRSTAFLAINDLQPRPLAFRYIAPNWQEYRDLALTALPGFCKRVEALGRPVVVNDAYWATLLENGEPLEDRLTPIQNDHLDTIYSFIRCNTQWSFVGYPRQRLRAATAHRFAISPYHFSSAVEQEMAASIIEAIALAHRSPKHGGIFP